MTLRTTIRRGRRLCGVPLGYLRAAPMLIAWFGGACLFARAQVIARPTHPLPSPISVPRPLTISENALPDGSVDLPFHTSVTATGGSGVYSFVLSGDPPPGIVLIQGPSTIAISGVPTTEGDYLLHVGIVDAVNGASASHSYELHIGPKLAHPEVATVNITQTETFHTADSDNSFFPAKLLDGEVFHLTDNDLVFMPSVVKLAEGFTLKDTISLFGPAKLTDPEAFHLTDTVVLRGSTMITDPEALHLTDSISVMAKNTSTLTIISPTVRTGATAYITAYFAYTGGTAPTGAVVMLVNGSSSRISGLSCLAKGQHINCTATYSAVGVAPSNNVLTISQAADSNYVAVSGTGFVTVTP